MPEHGWIDPRPFVVGPDDARVVFVLVHGFTGAPSEVRLVGERLADRGYRVIGPLLPGHGSDEEDLRNTDHREWYQAVRDALDWADETAQTVILGGLSMGGLISAVLAAERPDGVDGLVLFAPAFEIANPLFPLAGIGRFLVDSIPAANPPRAGLASPDGWKRLWHYDRRPLDAIWRLGKVQKDARRALPDVHQPTLLFQGRRDQTLHPMGAQRAFDRLAAPDKELIWLPRSGHCLTVDLEVDGVVDRVDAFASRLLDR